ncbi:MAG: GNAT family N-acetyltransferase [Proteobacteria bacterium]|nr:GNAT family N-acetyltransferase [Pseudomonadota bacterium]
MINSLKTEFHTLEDYFSNGISLKKLPVGENSIAYYAGIDLPHFNVLLHREITQEPERLINEAMHFFNQNGVYKWVYVVRNDLESAALQNALKNHSFTFEEVSTALCYSFEQNTEMVNEVSLNIRPVEHNHIEWLAVLQAGFESTDITTNQYCRALERAKSNGILMQHFLGYAQNVPVSTITLTFLNNCIRIDNVATHPNYQRLGYASQMVQFAINLVNQKRVDYCFLDASSKGIGLYKRIGFFELFTYNIYG